MDLVAMMKRSARVFCLLCPLLRESTTENMFLMVFGLVVYRDSLVHGMKYVMPICQISILLVGPITCRVLDPGTGYPVALVPQCFTF